MKCEVVSIAIILVSSNMSLQQLRVRYPSGCLGSVKVEEELQGEVQWHACHGAELVWRVLTVTRRSHLPSLHTPQVDCIMLLSLF